MERHANHGAACEALSVNLEITILLALVVFLLRVGETMPPTPDSIPILGESFMHMHALQARSIDDENRCIDQFFFIICTSVKANILRNSYDFVSKLILPQR